MNTFISSFGLPTVEFLNEPDLFIPILMIAEIWKGAGWSSIIYLASIMGIDGTMYEAAEIDGCTRFKKVWFITIPSIMPTVAMQLVLSIANILNAGFDSIYNLYNDLTAGVGETIDTLAYKTFLVRNEREVATAMGLFKTAVNFVLMIGGNVLTKKITGYSMYTFDN
jgi:putative aldouronate transport system permease protein